MGRLAQRYGPTAMRMGKAALRRYTTPASATKIGPRPELVSAGMGLKYLKHKQDQMENKEASAYKLPERDPIEIPGEPEPLPPGEDPPNLPGSARVEELLEDQPLNVLTRTDWDPILSESSPIGWGGMSSREIARARAERMAERKKSRIVR